MEMPLGDRFFELLKAAGAPAVERLTLDDLHHTWRAQKFRALIGKTGGASPPENRS